MSSAPKAQQIKWIHCIGDSITKGNGSFGISMMDMYPGVLDSLLGSQYKVRNLGNPGDTSTQILARFSDMTDKYIPYIATIYCGINDVVESVPDETYQSNLVSMVTMLKNLGVTKIMILGIHTVSGGTDTNYDSKRTVAQSVATSQNVSFCNLHVVSLDSGVDYIDSYHLHESGLAKLAAKIKSDIDILGW